MRETRPCISITLANEASFVSGEASPVIQDCALSTGVRMGTSALSGES
jgi:hypothetical protein